MSIYRVNHMNRLFNTDHGTRSVRDALEYVISVASEIINDGGATDATNGDLHTVNEIMDRHSGQISQAEMSALSRVVALGVEYMVINDYASDISDPEGMIMADYWSTWTGQEFIDNHLKLILS